MICGRAMTCMAAGAGLFNASGALTGGDSGDNLTTPTLMTGHTTVIAVDLVQIDNINHRGHRPVTTCTTRCGADIIVVGVGDVSCRVTLCTILRRA